MAELLDVALCWSERRAEVRELLQLFGSDYERTVEPWRELVRLAVARRHTWPDAPVREAARRLGKGEIRHEVGGDTTVLRVGKKAAGRLLDGVQHDGFP